MKVPTPTLLPILRSDGQGRILSTVLLNDGGMSLSEIAKRSDVDLPSVQREVKRLVDAGIVTTERRGNLRLVTTTDNEVTRALTHLISVTYGPVPILREALKDLDSISEAYVFGSYAKRYDGAPGSVPKDIDVLVVTGDYAAYDEALERIETIGKRLGREINTHRVHPDEWNHTPTPRGFVTTVKNSALVALREIP